jgi:hypothetical protein
MTQSVVEMVLGGLFVVFHAYQRFNTPSSNRSSTTALRYHLGATLYAALALLTYLALSRFPELLALIGSEVLDSFAKSLPRALMTALVLTVFIEKMPFFSSLDKWLREELQYIARIPHEARRLSRWLQQAAFEIAEPRRARLARQLEDDGFDPQDLVFTDDGSARFAWLRVEALMAGLAEWESAYRFSGYMDAFKDDYERLKDRREQLQERASRRFRVADELRAEANEPQVAELLTALRAEFREQSDELFAAACDFVSRGVLRSRIGLSSRTADLRRLGFVDPQVAPPGLSANQLVGLFAMLACVLLFGIVTAGSRRQFGFGQQLLLVAMIAGTYCCAIWCALYPKQRWDMARRSAGGGRPMAAYALSAVAAAGIGMLVNFGFKCLIFALDDHTVNRALTDAASSYPWLTLTFTLTAATAFHADNEAGELGARQRWIEAATQGAAMAAAALITVLWLRELGRGPQGAEFLARTIALSTLIGAVVGYVVPTAYRDSMRRAQAPVAAADTVVPLHAVDINAPRPTAASPQ